MDLIFNREFYNLVDTICHYKVEMPKKIIIANEVEPPPCVMHLLGD